MNKKTSNNEKKYRKYNGDNEKQKIGLHVTKRWNTTMIKMMIIRKVDDDDDNGQHDEDENGLMQYVLFLSSE
jgi:hypothetical protein